MRLSKKMVAGALSAALLVGAPVASAQTSAQQGYATPGGIVETQIENGPPEGSPNVETNTNESAAQTETVAQAENSGSLPFTGLDIGLIVAAGGILLALGLGMRRVGRAGTVA
jgi:hypothetical protein